MSADTPTIPGYDVIRLVGEGGMGRVFLARQRALDRAVCLKVLSVGTGEPTSEARERFEREAKLLAMAAHPHVLTILHYGTTPDEGAPYLVTEYIENGDLRRLIRADRSMPIARIRSILSQVGQALEHLHRKGILHRDLKPENILTPTDSLVKVADFGLAVLRQDRGRLTQSHRGIGTMIYASPEQQNGGDVDERSDQYSLAAIAYEMLTGRRPVGTFKPPSQVDPTLDPRIDGVLMKGLSADREGRYSELRAFTSDLDRALAPPAAAVRAPVLLAGVAALAIGASGSWWLFRNADPPRGLASLPAPAPAPAHPTPPPPEPEPPPPKISPEHHRLITFRAREIWVDQGAPMGAEGEARSVQNWLQAEQEIKKRVEERAYEIWVGQGSPKGEAGAAMAKINTQTAVVELLREMEAAHPDWR